MSQVKGVTGVLIFDGKSVVIDRTKTFGARFTVGKGRKQIPLRSISAVQWKPAGIFVNGYLEFTIAGGNENKSSFGSATSSAISNENAIVFSKKQTKGFEDIRDEIQLALHNNEIVLSDTLSTSSVADEIKKLAELKEQGILSPDEFEQKKKDLPH